MPVEGTGNYEKNRKNEIDQEADLRIDEREEHRRSVCNVCEHEALADSADDHWIEISIHKSFPVRCVNPAHVKAEGSEQDIGSVPHHRKQVQAEPAEHRGREGNDGNREQKKEIDPNVRSLRPANEEELHVMSHPVNPRENEAQNERC